MKGSSVIELKWLRPHTDEQDQPTESPAQYCDRVRAVLPNFPDEVICQFFYDHDSNVEHHAWLNYSSVSFQSSLFSQAQLQLPCFSAHPAITQYAEHFVNGNTSKRMSDIAAHFKTSGTWPVAPIVLANPDSELCTVSVRPPHLAARQAVMPAAAACGGRGLWWWADG